MYNQITSDMARFMTKDMLIMLQHDWSTQMNEAMNTSVSSYANKNRTYSKTCSLLGLLSSLQDLQDIHLLHHEKVFRKDEGQD